MTKQKRILLLVSALALLLVATLVFAACDFSFGDGGTLSVKLDENQVIHEGDDLETVKSYLTVTYTDSLGISRTVTSFTLSGTLTAGECELTVTYSGVTAKVTVNVVSGREEQLEDATGLEYALSEDGTHYIVTGIGSEAKTVFAIPSEHNNLPVKGIGEDAFLECENIVGIGIPSSIVFVCEDAFEECNNLNAVYISDIAAWCNIWFESDTANPLYCAQNLYLNGDLVTKLEFPSTVTVIADVAFYNCVSLLEVVFNDNITYIGIEAFYGCTGLENVFIPHNITTIESGAFEGCSSLTIYCEEEYARAYDWSGNCPVVATCDDISGLRYTLSEDNEYYIVSGVGNGPKVDFVIPLEHKEKPVKKIAEEVFRYHDMVSITIPSSIVFVGENAFYDCENLNAVYITDIAAWCSIIFEGEFANPLECAHNLYLNDQLVTDLEIPASVTEINPMAFFWATCIQTVTIPDNSQLKSIGKDAFYNCGCIIEIKFGENCQLETIAENAFWHCMSLSSLEIPRSVTTIERSAFWGTNLTTVTIPSSVTHLGRDAFYGLMLIAYCEAVEQPENWDGDCIYGYVVWDCNNNDIAEDGSLFVIQEDVRYLLQDGQATIALVSPNLESVHIPAAVTYKNDIYPVCAIEDAAWLLIRYKDSITVAEDNEAYYSDGNCLIDIATKTLLVGCKNSIIPADGSVTSIGDGAFSGVGLTSVEISSSVTSIGSRAFEDCSQLTNIQVPNSITSIGDLAFYNCNKLVYNEYDNAYYLGNKDNPYLVLARAKSTDISSCEINESTRFILDFAFLGCSNLVSITLPEGLVSVGQRAFAGCTFTEVKIPSSVAYIGSAAFASCQNLTTVTFDNSQLKSIESGTFQGCSSLVSIEIPKEVKTIDVSAFSGCNSLTEVHITDMTAWCNISFYDKWHWLDGKQPFSCAYDLYLNDDLVTEFNIPTTIIEINGYAFANCNSLVSVEIPSSVTIIHPGAFLGCNSLKAVYISDLVAWCNIEFGNWGSNPLNYAHNLYLNGELVTELEISPTVTEIKDYAFSGCSSLTSLKIPDSVISIGSYAFSGCGSLEEMTIPFVGASKDENDNTHLGYIFGAWSYSSNYSCVPASLKKVTITSATNIGSYAFYGCENITSIAISNSIANIGYYAFYGSSSLRAINYYGNQREWSAIIKDDSWNYNMGNYKINYNYGVVPKESVGLAYELSDDGTYYIVIGIGECTDETIIVPVTYEEVPVLEIGEYAFYGCNSVANVELNDQISVIGASAFESCRSLTSITIPSSVVLIDDDAFYDCVKLVEVYNFSSLPISIGSKDNGYIGYYAKAVHDSIDEVSIIDNAGKFFFITDNGTNYLIGCVNNETEFVLPDSYNGEGYEIYPYAFWYHTDLMSITISSGVTHIGDYAFGGAFRLIEVYNLSSLHIEAGSDENGLVACYARDVYTSKETSSKLSKDDEGYIIYTDDDVKLVVDYVGVETELVLPSDITGINHGAFYGRADIVSVEIPDGVTRLAQWTFDYCYSLTSITFGKNSQLKSIGGYAFYCCTSLLNIVLPSGVTSIDAYAFYYCTSLENVTIGDGVISIGDGAFGWCISLESITIPSSVTAMGTGAFYNCSSLTSIVIPPSVTLIGEEVFEYCSSLISIEIPSGVTSIGAYAFWGCDSLTSITIPSSVTSIGEDAFFACSNLATIYFAGTKEQWDAITKDLDGDYYVSNCPIICNYCSKSGATHSWDNCNVTLAATCTTVGVKTYTCSVCGQTKTESVPVIGHDFQNGICSSCGCETSLEYELNEDGTYYVVVGIGTEDRETFIVPTEYNGKPVKEIGYRAFYECASIVDVTIPNCVTIIGESAFEGCEALTNIILSDGVTQIEDFAFYYCTALKSILIPDSVTSIGYVAFGGCCELESITVNEGNAVYHSLGNCLIETATNTLVLGCKNSIVPDCVISIGEGSFESCELLIDITIPGGAMSIGDYAFFYCTAFTSIVIPDSVTSIGDYAFYYCSNLTTINFTGTEEQWNAITKGTDWDFNTGNYTIVYNYVAE